MVQIFKIHQIDQCNRLWVLDTGMVNLTRICSSQLLIFDLRDDRLLRRIVIPDDIATDVRTGQSLLITPVVEYDHNDIECQKPRVNISFELIIFYHNYCLFWVAWSERLKKISSHSQFLNFFEIQRNFPAK